MYIAIFLGLPIIIAVMLWLRLERSLLPRRSTKDFWKLSGLPLSKKIEGYIYGARTALYLRPATWGWLSRGAPAPESADTYHGKVVTTADAAKLITVGEPIVLTGLERVIPYPIARDIILSGPDQPIALMRCPCREQKADACEPRDVCMVIGEPFASFVVDHQPDKARLITAGEALSVIDAEDTRGHVHTAWFKDAMHNRFYAICNCCPCCCLGMKSFMGGSPRLAHSGYRPVVDPDLCSSCGECAEACPFSAVTVEDDRTACVDGRCMGCGVCASRCPSGAISLELAPDRGAPLDIDGLRG